MQADDSNRVARSLLALPPARLRMEFQFALLTAIGGIALGSGEGAHGIALLAIFMATFGFVFVDWMRTFELPPTLAYLAMAAAAAYCVRDFWSLQGHGRPQMISVAFLLVLVQGVLMLQRKSRRILEQIMVFCLLELVVAAIFNDAIFFGVLVIPIAFIGSSTLSLLELASSMELIDVTLNRELDEPERTRWEKIKRWFLGYASPTIAENRFVSTASPESAMSMYLAARPWSRYAVVTLAPAVFVIAMAFFYVLPRKVDAERSSMAGAPLVGFDEEIRLEQLGQVMQNPKIALKVQLRDLATDRPYRLRESLYLRGKVLENYVLDTSGIRPVSKWTATRQGSLGGRDRLPPVYQPPRSRRNERALYDEVQVSVTCEQMSKHSLFAIAPYHASGKARDVVHAVDRWTLSRESTVGPFPRISYEFGVHAFFNGEQTRWIARSPKSRRLLLPVDQSDGRKFRWALLRYDRAAMPTAAQMAEQVVNQIPAENRSSVRIADQLERFLSTDPMFSYTLKLDARAKQGVDPIEQFLASDRRGHCQYFASALAMMLRSVGIPSRLVVGYRTEEYSRISERYVARQQHAHAWVEALIDRSQLPENLLVAGQPQSQQYWMRLDPTPGASLQEDRRDSNVEGILDLANDIWDDYVVEMDAQRQQNELVTATGLGPARNSYQAFLKSIESQLPSIESLKANLRAGRLGGGQLSIRRARPLLTVALLLLGVFLVLTLSRLRFSKWSTRWLVKLLTARNDNEPAEDVMKPAIDFYAETLLQLKRIGVVRRVDETPRELMQRMDQDSASLRLLTESFEQIRYRGRSQLGQAKLTQALSDLTNEVDARLSQNA